MKKNIFLIVAVFIAILPLLYLAIVYPSLPQSVPTHFTAYGAANDYSNKGSLFFIVGLLSLISVGIFLLLTNIEKIDPKRSATQSKEIMRKIGFAVTLLSAVISIIIVHSSMAGRLALGNVMLPITGLFFAYLGNQMNSLKPNYFVGIRTPWTIEDEETWRKTHQMAGKLWFGGGILIAILALLTPPKIATTILLVILVTVTVIPIVYSYRYFQSHKR